MFSHIFFCALSLVASADIVNPAFEKSARWLHTVTLGTLNMSEQTPKSDVRRALLDIRRAHVSAHNAKVGVRWVAAVNNFADRTDSELQSFLGYKRVGGRRSHSMPTSMSFLAARIVQMPLTAWSKPLPESMNWHQQLQLSRHIRNQGGCGSCWAIATASALETHLELAAHGNSTMLDFLHLVRCMPNPQRCGGTGGCDGATAELAFDYVKHHGIPTTKSSAELVQISSCESRGHVHVTAQGFVQLPTNRVGPLLHAVATKGPVVVSADASNWFPYDMGIYDSCGPNAIVNHAVLLVGYGRDGSDKYWLIRNSWGVEWGEGGLIRVLRHENDDEYCGMDTNPQEGVGCANGPSQMRVCGMCGILADSSYPLGVQLLNADGI